MPQSPPTTTAANLRMLRRVHGALILWILLYGILLKQIPTPAPQGPDATLAALLGVVSVGMLAAGAVVRSRMIGRAYETLRVNPDDPQSLNRWRTGAIVSAAMAEAVVLYGLVLYLFGKPVKQAAPFFVVGTIAMLLWWPKQP